MLVKENRYKYTLTFSLSPSEARVLEKSCQIRFGGNWKRWLIDLAQESGIKVEEEEIFFRGEGKAWK